jgi:hypothetical protein
MARTIQIVRNAQQVGVTPNGTQNFTLSYTQEFTAQNAVDMPNEVFRMNARPLDPNDPSGPIQVLFEGVCTPVDLTTLPINAPNPGPITEFRVANFTDVRDNQNAADAVWQAMQEDVQSLKTALDQADELRVQQVFVPT